MKITRAGIQAVEHLAEIMQTSGDDMNHFVLLLQYTIHAEQARFEQGATLALGYGTPDHQIHQPGFIFEGNEGDAGGRRRALPHGDQTGDPYRRTIANGIELCCATNASGA